MCSAAAPPWPCGNITDTDWLREAGFEYVADWVLDDQPVDLRTTHGILVSLPYTQELNDLSMILIQGHRAAEYADRTIDQFEQLLSESAQATRVLCFTMRGNLSTADQSLASVRAIGLRKANRRERRRYARTA